MAGRNASTLQASIQAHRLNKEQFPLNLLLCSNISLCLYPDTVSQYMCSIHFYIDRGHTVVYCHVSTSGCQRRPCYTVPVEQLLVSYF